MSFVQAFKPIKWKVILSLVPFVFPLFQIWMSVQMAYDLYVFRIAGVDGFLDNLEDTISAFISLTEINLAIPLEPILRPLGWWSSNGIFVGPDGPLLPGSFAVAITYSLLIYVIWSLISLYLSNQR